MKRFNTTYTAIVLCFICLATLIGTVVFYESRISQIYAKQSTVLAEWEELAEDYAELTTAGAELIKKKTRLIWKLKALLKKCRNNRYYRVRSN